MSCKFKSKAIQPGIRSTMRHMDTPKNGEKIKELNKLYNHDHPGHFKKPVGNTRVIMLAIIAAAIFGTLSGFIGIFLFLSGTLSNTPILKDISLGALMPTNSMIVEHTQQIVINEEERVDEVIRQAEQAVVGIFKQKTKGETVLSDVYLNNQLIASGFILTEDGWVVTTQEAIDENSSYVIITHDKEIFSVENIVVDPVSKTAWLKFAASNLPVAKLANKEKLLTGQKLVSVKSAVNSNSDSTNVVRLERINWKNIKGADSLLRNSDQFDRLLKLQNGLSPGFLGAPLINLAGEFVGISLAGQPLITSALPVEYIQPIIPQILKSGLVVRPRLGISYLDLSEGVGAKIELVLAENKRKSITKGALVTSLLEHGPAEKAEIKVNDIIIKVDSTELDGIYGLTESIMERKVGDEILLTIWRAEEKEPLEVKVILE